MLSKLIKDDEVEFYDKEQLNEWFAALLTCSLDIAFKVWPQLGLQLSNPEYMLDSIRSLIVKDPYRFWPDLTDTDYARQVRSFRSFCIQSNDVDFQKLVFWADIIYPSDIRKVYQGGPVFQMWTDMREELAASTFAGDREARNAALDYLKQDYCKSLVRVSSIVSRAKEYTSWDAKMYQKVMQVEVGEDFDCSIDSLELCAASFEALLKYRVLNDLGLVAKRKFRVPLELRVLMQ